MDFSRMLTISEVIHLYGLEGPRDVHHGGARLLRKNASPRFLGAGIEFVGHEEFQIELSAYLMNGSHRRATGARFVTDFNRLMKWAVEQGYRKTTFISFPVPEAARTLPGPLTNSQVEDLLTALDASRKADLEWRIAIRALVILGLEIQEATNFSFAKAREMRGFYLHADQKGRLRRIPIPPDMQVLIARAQHQTEPGSTPPSEIRLSKKELLKEIRVLGNRIGVPGLTAQTLQQTAIFGE